MSAWMRDRDCDHRREAVQIPQPNFYPVKQGEEGRTVKLGVSRYSEMVAVDAVITQLRGISIHQRRSERFNSLDRAFQRRFRVNIQIHVQRVTLLIRDDLRINSQSSHQRRMRSAHDVE